MEVEVESARDCFLFPFLVFPVVLLVLLLLVLLLLLLLALHCFIYLLLLDRAVFRDGLRITIGAADIAIAVDVTAVDAGTVATAAGTVDAAAGTAAAVAGTVLVTRETRGSSTCFFLLPGSSHRDFFRVGEMAGWCSCGCD